MTFKFLTLMLLQSSNRVSLCFASFASASFEKDADAGYLGLQEEREREKASKQADESPEAELNLISDDEIEAMRREAEEEERNERKAEVSLSALINLRYFSLLTAWCQRYVASWHCCPLEQNLRSLLPTLAVSEVFGLQLRSKRQTCLLPASERHLGMAYFSLRYLLTSASLPE